MEMTQRGRLSDLDKIEVDTAMKKAAKAQAVLSDYRAVMVKMVERSSFREVSDVTGISTTTLQRWKREASG